PPSLRATSSTTDVDIQHLARGVAAMCQKNKQQIAATQGNGGSRNGGVLVRKRCWRRPAVPTPPPSRGPLRGPGPQGDGKKLGGQIRRFRACHPRHPRKDAAMSRPVDAVIESARAFLGERITTNATLREHHSHGQDTQP